MAETFIFFSLLYLKATRLRVGLLFNFGAGKFEMARRRF